MQLQELKIAYETCLLSKKKYDQLLIEREEIHEKIIDIRKKSEKHLFSSHFQDNQEEFNKWKQKLKEIDHQLDALGEDHEEELLQLKTSLINKILDTYPDSSLSYKQLTQEMAFHQQIVKKYTRIMERLTPFATALQEGAAASKVRGFHSLFSGRSSKAAMARSIQKAIEAANQIYDQIENENIRAYLDTFLIEANRLWNGQLYRYRFTKLYENFLDLMQDMEKIISQSRLKALSLEKRIMIWIEEYCH